jgi:hypothetical protein
MLYIPKLCSLSLEGEGWGEGVQPDVCPHPPTPLPLSGEESF